MFVHIFFINCLLYEWIIYCDDDDEEDGGDGGDEEDDGDGGDIDYPSAQHLRAVELIIITTRLYHRKCFPFVN